MDGSRIHERVYFVKAEFDTEANVWHVSQTDVPGLAVEAETPEELLSLLKTIVPELLELNGVVEDDARFSVMFDHFAREPARI
jgi:hypothetical protein